MDGIHAGRGEAWERRRFGIIKSTLGVRAALALKQAGVFEPLDDPGDAA